MKKFYLFFLIFLLLLTIALSGLLVDKILKNESTNDVRYMNTTISSKKAEGNVVPEESIAMIEDNSTTIIIKNVQSEETSTVIEYVYHIKITDVAGSILYNYNGLEDYLKFSPTGEATFTLKSNESITLFDISKDLAYSIEQSTNDNYKTVVSGDSTNIFTGITSEENVVEFKNTSTIVVTKNPETADNKVLLLVSVDALLVFLFVVLRKTKVQRYEI